MANDSDWKFDAFVFDSQTHREHMTHPLIVLKSLLPVTELAGEKELNGYCQFLTEYAGQLSGIELALDETLGDAWDFTLDPISLQVSSTTKKSFYSIHTNPHPLNPNSHSVHITLSL